MQQMAAEGQSDKMETDMGVKMKQRYITEFLHVEKTAPINIHQCLPNVYGDQTVDVSTVRQWVVHFSGGDSDVKDKPWSRHSCTAVTSWNEEHLNQFIHVNQWITTVYEAEYQLWCIGNDGGNVGISQSFWQVDPIDTHTGSRRTPYASLSGPYENEDYSFSDHIINGDKMGCYHYELETKQQSIVKIQFLHWRKSLRYIPQQVKWHALPFKIGKGWAFCIFWNSDKTSTPTTTSQCWLNWGFELPKSGQSRRQLFSYNTIMPGPYTSWKIMEHTANLGWTVLPHSTYSWELVLL